MDGFEKSLLVRGSVLEHERVVVAKALAPGLE